jgi:hypothetical protein
MIVSLPMRGIAGAVTFSCTMTHGSMATRTVESMHDCDHAGTKIGMVQPPAGEHGSADVAHQDKSCDKIAYAKHCSCRACLACHIGATAPPPLAVAGAPAEHFANRTIPPFSSFTGWVPSRIERPPRL